MKEYNNTDSLKKKSKKYLKLIPIGILSVVLAGIAIWRFFIYEEIIEEPRLVKEGTAEVISFSTNCLVDGWCGYGLEDVDSREKLSITTGMGLGGVRCRPIGDISIIDDRRFVWRADGSIYRNGQKVNYAIYKYSEKCNDEAETIKTVEETIITGLSE